MFQSCVYYLVARSYVENSAGIKAMHILCHTLNTLGQDAFLVPVDKDFSRNSGLDTPLLSKSIRDMHFKNESKVVGIYDESVVGNPMKVPAVVHWFLNRASYLGGSLPKQTSESELRFVFAKEINNNLPRLFVNTIDFDFFLSRKNHENRSLKLFYAGKLRSLGVDVKIPEGAIEIHRSGPMRQSREELRKLFSMARVFYVAEDTAMVLEAAICGCPSIQLLEYFKGEPLSQEDGGVGLVDSETEEFAFDKESILRYISTLKLRELSDVAKFIIQTQNIGSDFRILNKPKYRFSRFAKLKIQFYKARAGFQASGLKGSWAVMYAHFQLTKDGK